MRDERSWRQISGESRPTARRDTGDVYVRHLFVRISSFTRIGLQYACERATACQSTDPIRPSRLCGLRGWLAGGRLGVSAGSASRAAVGPRPPPPPPPPRRSGLHTRPSWPPRRRQISAVIAADPSWPSFCRPLKGARIPAGSCLSSRREPSPYQCRRPQCTPYGRRFTAGAGGGPFSPARARRG